MAAPPRPLMMIRLLAGRGAFRVCVQLMAVTLLSVWGAATYGEFANALGLSSWLVFLPTAAEKAALKILPRTRMTTASLATLAFSFAAAPVGLVVSGLVVALLLAPSSAATLYLATASWSACTGLLMTVSGLHRLRGRPALDAITFGVAAAVVVTVTATTWATGLSPRTHLLVLVGVVVIVIGVTVRALPAEWVRARRPRSRRLVRAFARSTVLLGLTELLSAVTVSLLFLVLAVTGRVTDSGPFYLAMMASAFLCSFVLYQLKLHQPSVSARFRGTGAAVGRASATRVLRVAEVAGLVFAVVLGLCLLIPITRAALLSGSALPVPTSGYVALAVLVLIEMAMAIMLIYASFLLENTDSRILTLTAGSAALRLAATVLCGFALAPALGAIGGFCALVLGLTAEAAVLRRLLLRARPGPGTPNVSLRGRRPVESR